MSKSSKDSKTLQKSKTRVKKNTKKYDWKVKITFIEFKSQAKRDMSYDMWVKSFFHTN